MIFGEKPRRYNGLSLEKIDWSQSSFIELLKLESATRFSKTLLKEGRFIEFKESYKEKNFNKEFWIKSGQKPILQLDDHYYYRINDAYLNPRHGLVFFNENFLLETKIYTGKKRIFGKKRTKQDDFFDINSSLFDAAQKKDKLIYGLCTSPGMNYCHFNLDIASGIHALKAKLLNNEVELLWSGKFSSFHRQLLDLLNIPENKITYCNEPILFCKGLIKSSSNFQTYKKSLSISILNYFDEILNKVKESSPQNFTGPKKIIIERKPETSRRINEWHNWDKIIDWSLSNGFVSIDPGMLSISEQVRLFNNADIIIAQHGAALTNCAYLKDGAKVIEFLPDKRLTKLFYCLSKLRNAQHYIILSESERISHGDALHAFKFHASLDKLKQVVEGF